MEIKYYYTGLFGSGTNGGLGRGRLNISGEYYLSNGDSIKVIKTIYKSPNFVTQEEVDIMKSEIEKDIKIQLDGINNHGCA